LDNNQIKEVPPQLANLKKIQILMINSNMLTTLPIEIKQMQSLKSVQLRENPISDEEKEKIKNMLPKVKLFF